MSKNLKTTLNAFDKKPGLILPLQFFAAPGEEQDKVDDPDDSEEEEEKKPEEEKKTFTQDELNKIIQKEKAKAEKKAKADLGKLVQDKLDEAEKLKNMTEDERVKHEKENLEKELATLKAEKERFGLEKEATKILAEKNIAADETILSFVIREDAEKTKEAIDSFTDLISTLVKKGINEAIRQETPKGDGAKEKTLAQRLAEEKNNKKEAHVYNPWAK